MTNSNKEMSWDNLLSTYQYDSNNKENCNSEYDNSGRTAFQKDYDKIVFSKAFRRLAKKTQVHPLCPNDHIHNRLIHSIEVGSVGRSIALKIKVAIEEKYNPGDKFSNSDIGTIVQSACLAHDIGNPPFGHAGEYAIRSWFSQNEEKVKLSKELKNDFINFEGNAQGFRLVTNILENKYKKGGLRLTYATLGSMLKYPWYSNSISEKKKYNFYYSEQKFIDDLFDKLQIDEFNNANNDTQNNENKNPFPKFQRHPLSFIVEAADDICYKILDLEDSYELGLTDSDTVHMHYKELSGDKYPSDEDLVVVRNAAIENLCDMAKDAFLENYEAIMSGTHTHPLLKSSKDEEITEAVSSLKKTTEKQIFNSRNKIECELGADHIISSILDLLVNAVTEYILEDVLSKKDKFKLSFKTQRALSLLESENILLPIDRTNTLFKYNCYLMVIDFISGMTDNYATTLAQKINGNLL